ncbi:MAG: glycosyl transferase, group 1 [Actinomycetia bacterium]|nr:glycosyl transferase, group 1 [Actinomycetes bacterium]
MLQLLGPSTGGIRRVVGALTDGLRANGWSVVTAGPAGVLDGLGGQDAVVPVPAGFSPGALRAARRALAELVGDVDLVHAHGLKPGWLVASLRPRPKLVTSVHNLVLDEAAGRAAPLLRVLEGRIPSVSDRTIALSTEVARRFAGAPGVVTIPPAADPPRPERPAAEVRAAYGVGPDERLLVTAARLHPQKDLPMLLDAVDRLRHDVPGVRLLVVGEGPEGPAMRSRATSLGLDDVVTFAGRVHSAADELAAADVVVISSRWESGPLVLFEALQLGKPVVTTAVGAAPDVVTDRVSGRLVPPGDAEAFAAAVAEVLADPVAAAAMGEAGRVAVSGPGGPEAMVSATEAVYREVLA